MLQPFMTTAPKQIIEQLGLDDKLLAWDTIETFGNVIPENTKVVEKGVPIFPRLDAEVEIEYIREQMQSFSVKTPQEEEKSKQLKHQKFQKLQLMIS